MKKKIIVLTIIFTLIGALLIFGVLNGLMSDETEGDIFTLEIGEFTLDGRDVMRKANTLVLYSSNDYQRNEYGYEVLVDEKTNTVIAKDVMLEVCDGSYILSGHGDAGRFLKRVEIGDLVKVKMDTVKVTRHLKNSNLKKIEIENEKADQLIEDRKNDLIDINLTAINEVREELDAKIADFKNYFESLDEGVGADTRTVYSKMQSISRLIDMKYYLTLEHNAVDGRAIWHSPNGSAIDESNLEGVKQFAKRLYDMGINTLYVQTFTCGMTMYFSEYLQFRNPKMESFDYGEYGNDYILALISECHKFGIEVHAWFNVLDAEMPNGESPDYIKEDWVSVDLNGSDKGHFLDPSNTEVREFLKDVVTELLTKYNFDGISYDYIRYSECGEYEEYRDSGFTSNAIELFSNEYNYSLGNLTEDVKNDLQIRAKWHEFKQKSINQLLKELASLIRGIDPEITISASPFGNIEMAKSVYMQDVTTWMEKGYIDVVLPMIYTDGVDRFCDLAEDYDRYSHTALQYSGIYVLYNKSTLRRNQEIIEAIKSNNISGTSLFASQNYITRQDEEKDYVYQILSLTTHNGTAVLPTANPNDVLSAWREQLLDRCNRIYYDKMTISERNAVEVYLRELSVEMSNPSDVYKLLLSLRSFEIEVSRIKNAAVVDRITSAIEYIYEILDASISRQMIRYGYWDTDTMPQRPDPTKIKFDESFAG